MAEDLNNKKNDENGQAHKIGSIENGVAIIKSHLKNLPNKPGVYRMINAHNDVVYVGKAKALKKRVVSYTYINGLPMRLKRMVAETVKMEFITTHTEAEALLLESNMIKELKPQYNILLRDDKSFAYILITKDHDFPQIAKHRGAQKRKGKYFGPYTSAGAVARTINDIQKTFMLRNCSDSSFANRSRPCLQYHIKRCTAPCVGYVDKSEYAKQVKQTKDFIEGRTDDIKKDFVDKMQKASDALDYETAAQFRDKIKRLSYIQSRQNINMADISQADIISIISMQKLSCIQVFFIRNHKILGNNAYFIKHNEDQKEPVILSNFIGQFYTNKPIPKHIYINKKPDNMPLLSDALSALAKHKITLSIPAKGKKKELIDWVYKNTEQALERHLSQNATQKKILENLTTQFDLEDIPSRIEIYDNSHISGSNMIGAMVVADNQGFRKNAYRKFNIKQASASDDFGMMKEVMTRRFKRLSSDDKNDPSTEWPDLILIDGGKGQLSSVKESLEELGLWDQLNVVAISKGPDRNAGREQFHIDGKPSFQLPENDPVLYYLQRLRDEAHRFAISSHRTRRKMDIEKSPLDEVAGIGPKRKKALLQYFGSAKAVSSAALADLEKVEGISKTFAQKIYDHFH